MTTLSRLQQWYLNQCNGDWEHSYGIQIDNLDNPGWTVKIDLVDTPLANHPFADVEYGVDEDGHPSGNEWMTCSVKNAQFVAAGGPLKLDEILEVFLAWAEPVCNV